jgi:DNA polymerase V
MVKVYGDSMEDANIHSGDVLIVDRSITPADGKIVLACFSGDLFVKRIRKFGDDIFLVSENNKYRPVKIMPDSDFEIWGVITSVIHNL